MSEQTSEEVDIEEILCPPVNENRLMLLNQSIDEKIAGIISATLFDIYQEAVLGEDKENAPIDFIISTTGGVAVETFGIYDLMRLTREKVEIHTLGVGKVMSSGLCLLAAGTKGKRKIGKNTRLMIHDVVSSHEGHLFEIKDELDETKKIRHMYQDIICAESNLTKADFRRLLRRRKNIYFSAEEAVEFGLADIII